MRACAPPYDTQDVAQDKRCRVLYNSKINQQPTAANEKTRMLSSSTPSSSNRRASFAALDVDDFVSPVAGWCRQASRAASSSASQMPSQRTHATHYSQPAAGGLCSCLLRAHAIGVSGRRRRRHSVRGIIFIRHTRNVAL